MKKYISLMVCAVLLIASLVLGNTAQEKSIAGRGDGTDSQVTTVEQFVDVLNFFDRYNLQSANGVSLHSATSGLNTESAEEYTSATFYNKSKASSDYSYSANGRTTSQRMTYVRELTINLTKTAAFYHSVGKIMQGGVSTSNEGDRETYSMMVDFDFYLYVTTKVTYVKFNKFDMTSSGVEGSDTDVVSKEQLNVWLDAGDDAAKEIISVNEDNYAILSAMGDYFEEFKLTKFNQRNNVYTLKEDQLKNAFAIIFDTSFPDEIRGSFKLNLTDKVEPKVSIIQSYSSTSDNGGSSNSNSYAENSMVFSYINNTVIDASLIPENPPKFDSFMGGIM